MNQIKLCGVIVSEPVHNHSTKTTHYSLFKLSVKRLSGAEDILDVIIPTLIYKTNMLSVGDYICVEGQLRSYNNKNAETNKLKINVWAYKIYAWNGEYINQVELSGTLCKKPIYRQTPYGREISDLMLAVPRAAVQNQSYLRFDYIPCITWGSVARMCSELDEKTYLYISGRFQSRNYYKQTDGAFIERTAYEVSVSYADFENPNEKSDEYDQKIL